LARQSHQRLAFAIPAAFATGRLRAGYRQLAAGISRPSEGRPIPSPPSALWADSAPTRVGLARQSHQRLAFAIPAAFATGRLRAGYRQLARV
jgi:hypothetical protein